MLRFLSAINFKNYVLSYCFIIDIGGLIRSHTCTKKDKIQFSEKLSSIYFWNLKLKKNSKTDKEKTSKDMSNETLRTLFNLSMDQI